MSTSTAPSPRPRGVVKSGVLSAWMQQPPGTNPQMFIDDPQKASMTAALAHIEFCRKHGIRTIELGAAHSYRTSNVPPESMADPVAHHVNMETPKDGGEGRDFSREDGQTLIDVCAGEVQIGTLGAFQNLLHANLIIRRQEIEHVRRAIRAASLMQSMGLGTEGVTIFVGRDTTKTIEQNMHLFATVVIPLIRYAKEHGVKLFIENCPMVGWSSTAEVWTQNIANCPLHWILIACMVEAAELKGWCYLNYDPSHDILQGSRPEWSFAVMALAGYAWFIGRFHGKDLSKQTGLLAMSGSIGQRVAGGPWSKMCGDQPNCGATEHNPLAMANGLQVDWFGMMASARLILNLDMSKIVFTNEHEQGDFRNTAAFDNQEEHWEIAGSLVAASVRYIQGIDAAADQHVAMHDIIAARGRGLATWSWQAHNPNRPDSLIGVDGSIDQAMAWQMPKLPTHCDLDIGD